MTQLHQPGPLAQRQRLQKQAHQLWAASAPNAMSSWSRWAILRDEATPMQ
jgi:hypothetical protein